MRATEQNAEKAIAKLRLMIEAAENANQAGEDAVVMAANGPPMHKVLATIISAIGSYLPPDGISAGDCLSIIIEATDNPTFNDMWLRMNVSEEAKSDQNERLIDALRRIEGGSFDGASTLAISGQWQEAFQRLQQIARDAIAA